MSSVAEEMRIREELEKEVDMEMEDEIKEGIYKLALRLHHLYRQQQIRKKKQGQGGAGKKICSELRINIRMEGGTKIEFREIKREVAADPGKGKLMHISAPAELVSYKSSNGGFVRVKKFDWTQTLRSGDGGNNKLKKAFIC